MKQLRNFQLDTMPAIKSGHMKFLVLRRYQYYCLCDTAEHASN